MKIYDKSGMPVSRLYQKQVETEKKQKGRAVSEEKSDSIILSAKAAMVQKAAKAAAEQDEVRVEKVEQIKEEIEQGTYDLDSKKIAEAMLKKKE
jgi:negative regulator of flagellin synthesis FlgM